LPAPLVGVLAGWCALACGCNGGFLSSPGVALLSLLIGFVSTVLVEGVLRVWFNRFGCL
jgi:hypothetical protein